MLGSNQWRKEELGLDIIDGQLTKSEILFFLDWIYMVPRESSEIYTPCMHNDVLNDP